jgi:hypothetical protein
MISDSIKYSQNEIEQGLEEFYSLYQERPVQDNQGGMKSPHLFNTWLLVKKINPKLIIESGVWKGLGTWVLEKAAPNADIISFDVTYKHLEYVGEKVKYFQQDITTIEWDAYLKENYPNVRKEEIIIFLDDHQNFLDRIEFVKSIGLTHVLYEDNYPIFQGDTYSPKKVLSMQDYVMDKAGDRTSHKFSFLDHARLTEAIEVYQEMPPIFKTELTRWGDAWDEENYPTKSPYLSSQEWESKYPIYFDEAASYTWICYMRTKQN